MKTPYAVISMYTNLLKMQLILPEAILIDYNAPEWWMLITLHSLWDPFVLDALISPRFPKEQRAHLRSFKLKGMLEDYSRSNRTDAREYSD